ncbi:3-isopropylmalate dehydratase small subunit [Sphingobium sp. H39-3-25]|uniref:3-isopropylmalate dehydratase small subunit n=1 Tax=Sphingobium arseniciresistens TaxID=3030834 RepID=UPI0023B9B2B5|nr:3-isopropylmalate dehydratase small subunit [Sphingobium arseniciresistens]
MKPFSRIEGIAAPLPMANVDTDKILPARYLKTTEREGLGQALFASLRCDADGREVPGFILNRQEYREARILIALENFGCGSSREHAPWALADFGIRCVVAPGFAEIFYNNCIKNGILPVVLPRDEVDRLLVLAGDPATARMSVDLERQIIEAAEERFAFEIEPGAKRRLLEGLDEIVLTLEHEGELGAFEGQHASQPFLWQRVPLKP